MNLKTHSLFLFNFFLIDFSESRNATNESAVKSDEIMKKRDQIGMELDLFKSEYERTLSRQKESYEQQLQQLELSAHSFFNGML